MNVPVHPATNRPSPN